jgi:hypothetical protein
VVVVAPREAVGSLEPGERASVAEEAVTQTRDELLASVDLAGTAFGRVARVAAPPGLETLARAGAVPLVGRWREGGATLVYVGPDPAEGDWALSVSFPIFWANVAAWAAVGRGGGGFASARPGDVVAVAGGGGPATVVEPDGTRRELATDVFRPERVGLYRLSWGDGREDARAVSLLSETETMAVGARVELPSGILEDAKGQASAAAPQRLTGWLVGLALLGVVGHAWALARARGF